MKICPTPLRVPCVGLALPGVHCLHLYGAAGACLSSHPPHASGHVVYLGERVNVGVRVSEGHVVYLGERVDVGVRVSEGHVVYLGERVDVGVRVSEGHVVYLGERVDVGVRVS
jgi:hypothetical protein